MIGERYAGFATADWVNTFTESVTMGRRPGAHGEATVTDAIGATFAAVADRTGVRLHTIDTTIAAVGRMASMPSLAGAGCMGHLP